MTESEEDARAASTQLQTAALEQGEPFFAADRVTTSIVTPTEFSAGEKEDNRVQRERFLSVLAGFQGKECSWDLYGGVNVEASFLSTDSAQTAFLVKDLASGVGTVRSAMLRGDEVIALRAEAPKQA